MDVVPHDELNESEPPNRSVPPPSPPKLDAFKGPYDKTVQFSNPAKARAALEMLISENTDLKWAKGEGPKRVVWEGVPKDAQEFLSLRILENGVNMNAFSGNPVRRELSISMRQKITSIETQLAGMSDFTQIYPA